MGNAAYRVKRAAQISHSNNHHGQPDYHANSHSFTTTNAPWNVTQWIDPYDPNPRVTSMPIILVIRR